MRHSSELPGFDYHAAEAAPKVGKDQVLEAIVKLHAEKGDVDYMNLSDPAVAKLRDLFDEWTSSIGEIVDNPQKKLIEYLQQNMIMFDAGLITNKEGLMSLDKDLEDMLAQTRRNEDNFMEYETTIGEYRQRIGDLLSQVDK